MTMFAGRRIVVVDDEKLNLEMLEEFLQRSGATAFPFNGAEPALAWLELNDADAVVTDIKMGGMSGIEFQRLLHDKYPGLPVLLMTAFGTIESAVEAMHNGAYYYLTKPFKLKEFGILLSRALEHRRLVEENHRLKEELSARTPGRAFVIGKGEAMNDVMQLVKTVAPTHSNVLILGESGTGKEVVARTIHELSPRASGPFITVNCAALPEGLVESELFGHTRGSFTGAIKDSKGKFELADGGTILLDEVSEMPMTLQPKLLRVIQEREFFRVGSGEVRKANVRVIATSNRNLQEEIAAGRFRQDLFFRLNVIPIMLPPLRERVDDIPPLVQHFLTRFAVDCKKEIHSVSDEAMAVLRSYNWPGNVRELENAIERAVVLCTSDRLEKQRFSHLTGAMTPSQVGTISGATGLSLDELEKRHILSTLQLQSNNRTRTAEVLGISIRTLRNKLHEYRAQGDFHDDVLDTDE